MRLGLQPTEVWFTAFGDCPQIQAGGLAAGLALRLHLGLILNLAMEALWVERLQRLGSLGIIRGFKTTLVVPPLLGGDWVWAAVLANAKSRLGLANALAARLPFVSEIVLNASLPDGVGPNLAVLFYSRDFDKEADFIRNAPGIEYHEVYRVAEYSFPVAMPLSRDEKALVRYLAALSADTGSGIRPLEVVLKADLQNQQSPAGKDEYRGFNLGIGFRF